MMQKPIPFVPPDTSPQPSVMGLSAELRLVSARSYGWDMRLTLANASSTDLLIPIHDYEQLRILERTESAAGQWLYPPILCGYQDFTEVIHGKSRQEFEFQVIREGLVADSPGLTYNRPFLSLKGNEFSAWYHMRFAHGYEHPESLREFSSRFEEAKEVHVTAWFGELRSNRIDFSAK